MTAVSAILVSLLTVSLAMAFTALAARRAGRWSVIDVTWGLGFVALAWANLLASGHFYPRQLLVAALVSVWGLRLAWHIGSRSRGHGEDPRYAAIRERQPSYLRAALVPQALVMLVVSLPAIVVMWHSPRALGWIAILGLAVYVIGLFFEVVGDAQLAAYKRDPNRGPIMDRGLWAWTRHPNYFGDAAVWFGIWAIAAEAGWAAALTVISPIAMTHFLRNVTGAKLLEQSMSKRTGYAEYAARTPMFFPRPRRDSQRWWPRIGRDHHRRPSSS